MQRMSTADLVDAMKAAAEPTRLRILWLLRQGPLTVKDLTRILAQSQPRLSRHLKLLVDGGLVDRAPEGSWAYFHLAEPARREGAAAALLDCLNPDDPVLVRDAQRLAMVKRERDVAAQAYFAQNASDWDRLRALHVAEADVEMAMRRCVGRERVDLLVDLGTGTGRILELFAETYTRGLGFDQSPAMLSYARAKLNAAGVSHAQVRQGDLFALPLADAAADVVVMHQVLHFLGAPEPAIAEAARVLAPGGRLLIVDFAPHDLEFLRVDHAHQRLGFSDRQMRQWLDATGLTIDPVQLLMPTSSTAGDQLTVSLWLARRPPVSARAARAVPSRMERVS
jgi:ArsR family transcriptional regulator